MGISFKKTTRYHACITAIASISPKPKNITVSIYGSKNQIHYKIHPSMQYFSRLLNALRLFLHK